MNLLLLQESQLLDSAQAELSTRQITHLRDIIKVENGQRLKIGLLNGQIGTGILNTLCEPWRITLEHLDICPPKRLPISLILALPRPQMIKRIMQTIATMGVKRLYLIQTEKVEKSYWQSPSVTDEAIEHNLILGAEQGIDTFLPRVKKVPRFKDFIETILPQMDALKNRFIADPNAKNAAPKLNESQEALIAIGPEGGFTAEEVILFETRGFSGFHLGKRILKVETAVTVILASLPPPFTH